jgi:hypothetical protein
MSADFEKAPPTLCDVCATEENGIYRAIVYNHNALEIKNQPDFIDSLCFDAPDGEYIATYATIKQHKGSAYETWLQMGMPENLSKIQEEMLQAHSVPEYDFTIVKSKDGKIEITDGADENNSDAGFVFCNGMFKTVPKGSVSASSGYVVL